MLLVVLFTPVLLGGLHVPRVVKVVLTKLIVKRRNFGVLIHSDDFRLFNGINLCCVVFLTNLRVGVKSFGRGQNGTLILKLLTFVIPVNVNLMAGVTLLGCKMLASILLTDVCTSRALITCPVIVHCNISQRHDIDVTIKKATIASALALLILTIINNVFGKRSSNFF